MPVGMVGAYNPQSRRGRKMPDNPYDRATIVSVYPESITERKSTIYPGEWTIPAAPPNGFSLLTITPSSWWRDPGNDQQIIEIQVNSYTVAKSIVEDYCNSLLRSKYPSVCPGLFYVAGEFDEKKILSYQDEIQKKPFGVLLQEARARQKAYFEEMVAFSDALWATSNGNPRAISHTARLAAEQLGLKNKPWMGDFAKMQMENCPSCGNLVNPNYPTCANCKYVVNKEKAKALGII